MLSRHLYRYDEVKASLLYCILVKRYEEGLFWCMELFDSLGGGDSVNIFWKAWLTGIGCSGFGFLSLFQELSSQETIEEDQLYRLLITLMYFSSRDSSVYGLLLKGAMVTTQVDSVVPMTLPGWCENLSPHHQCTFRAIKQKKYLLAWTLLRSLWSTENIWEFLEQTAEPYQQATLDILKTSSFFDEYKWEQRALVLLCLCSEKKAFQKIEMCEVPPSLVIKKEEWTALEGKRARRVHKIPTEAILWGTRRSLEPNTQTNMGELLRIEPSLKDSPYWEEVATSMGSWKHIRKADEIREAFYEMYFPDDIPDEWSVKDREKSHGYGMLIGTNKANQQFKGWRSLIGRMPSLGLLSFTDDALKKYNWEWTSFEEAYAKPLEIEWMYEPRKKKIVVKK